MSNFTVIQAGPMDAWDGKRFVDQDLGLQNFGLSVNATPPGEGAPFWHSHATLEELYIFLDGEGEMAVEGEVFPVRAGTIVKVGTNAMHHLHANADSSGPLKWLCVRGGGMPLAEVGRDATLDQERPAPW